MEPLKIIARHRDGRIVKGTTQNFWPDTASFLVIPYPAVDGAKPVQVTVAELKAMFVVRDLAGQPGRTDARAPGPGSVVQGAHLEVTFADGEVLLGTSMNYDRAAAGFFLFPYDPQSNNKAVFVVNAAVRSVRPLFPGHAAAPAAPAAPTAPAVSKA